MFCDLVDSTRLASTLDPEDLRRVLWAFREACVGTIMQNGGTIGQYLGDAVLAYFGFPLAHEDDPRRAVRAGLAAVAALRGLGGQLLTEGVLHRKLEARAGVHTGIVIVADLGHGPYTERTAVVGATTSMAARLQQAAGPGQVFISDATHDLVKDAFRFADVGLHEFKGMDRPVHVYAAEEEHLADTRPARRGGFDAVYINRKADLQTLSDAWRATKAGANPIVVVEGEAGIGKSRLVHEFCKLIVGEACKTVTMICAEDDRSSAFRPAAAWLMARLGLLPDAPPDETRHALSALIAASRPAEADLLAPLSALLGCLSEADAAALAALPRRRRKRIVDAMAWVFINEQIGNRPLVILVEDLHWADDSTLAFLGVLADRLAEAQLRAMLLLTMRSGFTAALPRRASVRLVLEGLSQADSRRLAEAVAPSGLAPRLLQKIVLRTGGVPLYIEEVARTAEATAQDDDNIPMTLRGSLMAQLDRLGDAKPVAQLASVLGRSFRLDVLEAMAEDIDPISLRQALLRLREARFLDFENSSPAYETYSFRHILIRDAAYESLLREQRRAWHSRIAVMLRERFPQTVVARPELLAQHLAAAGRNAEAVETYEAAARQKARETAHVEAMEHCRTALRLLAHMPDTQSRIEAEINLNVLLAVQLTVLRGNAEPEVLEAFERAHAAAERLGEVWAVFRTLRGLITYHLVRGTVAAGHAVSQRLMSLAQTQTDPALLIQAHRARGLALLYLGRFAEARQDIVRVIELYQPMHHAAQRFEYGSDPAVLARSHLGWVEWFQGKPDQAELESTAAIAAARALDHPHSLAFALGFRACIGQFSNRPRVAAAAANEIAQLARKHDFPYWAAWAEILQGWAQARQGDAAAGEHLLRQGLRRYTATGAELLCPYAFFLLADAIDRERRSEALSLLDQALDQAVIHSILFYQAEMLRLKAELLELSDPREAVETLQRAVSIARSQGSIAIVKQAAKQLASLRAHLSA